MSSASWTCSLQRRMMPIRLCLRFFFLLLLLFETATVTAAAAAAFLSPGIADKQQRQRMPTTPITKTSSFNSIIEEEDFEDDDSPKPGMKEAFRALDALQSLDLGTTDDDSDNQSSSSSSVSPKATPKIQVTTDLDLLQKVPQVTPEKELESYKSLVQELETNEEAEHYAEMIAELGGTTSQIDDTYSQVMLDLGGTPKTMPAKDTADDNLTAATTTTTTTLNQPPSTEEFMEAAFQEAMREVHVNNPHLNKSVLDDAELMQEIEKIFDSGNEKLLTSLEEIRREQEALAQASARASADRAEQRAKEDVERLQMAESNLRRLLNTVDRERQNVEDAKRDLERVNAQLENDILYKLKTGGIVKQSAFAGLLLFSVRSILDSLSALQGDESALGAALVQGAIAFACAILFNVL